MHPDEKHKQFDIKCAAALGHCRGLDQGLGQGHSQGPSQVIGQGPGRGLGQSLGQGLGQGLGQEMEPEVQAGANLAAGSPTPSARRRSALDETTSKARLASFWANSRAPRASSGSSRSS